MTANKTVRRPATRSTSPVRKTRPVRPAVSKTAARATKPVKAAPRVVKAVFTPLADGQIWQMGEANLKVEMVGKLLVHYKLAKPNAVRTPTSIAGITKADGNFRPFFYFQRTVENKILFPFRAGFSHCVVMEIKRGFRLPAETLKSLLPAAAAKK
jgi:hypothetical protein